MVPFLDQINFSTLNNVEWNYEKKSGIMGFSIKATKPIKRGEELLSKYPELNNKELFMQYGFVDSLNEAHNPVTLYLKIADTDPLIQFKQFWFKNGDP